jgi:hypothetical protein
MHPLFVRISVALFDTSLSVTCLLLFVIQLTTLRKHMDCKGTPRKPALASQASRKHSRISSAKPQSNAFAKRLYATTLLNLRWTSGSVAFTFLYLTIGGSLQPVLNSAWLLVGVVECAVRVYTVNRLLQPYKQNGRRATIGSGRHKKTSQKKSSVQPSTRASDDSSDDEKPAPNLFDE